MFGSQKPATCWQYQSSIWTLKLAMTWQWQTFVSCFPHFGIASRKHSSTVVEWTLPFYSQEWSACLDEAGLAHIALSADLVLHLACFIRWHGAMKGKLHGNSMHFSKHGLDLRSYTEAISWEKSIPWFIKSITILANTGNTETTHLASIVCTNTMIWLVAPVQMPWKNPNPCKLMIKAIIYIIYLIISNLFSRDRNISNASIPKTHIFGAHKEITRDLFNVIVNRLSLQTSITGDSFSRGSNRRADRHPSELRGFQRQCEEPENQWLVQMTLPTFPFKDGPFFEETWLFIGFRGGPKKHDCDKIGFSHTRLLHRYIDCKNIVPWQSADATEVPSLNNFLWMPVVRDWPGACASIPLSWSSRKISWSRSSLEGFMSSWKIDTIL